jgi:hypothetical protein
MNASHAMLQQKIHQLKLENQRMASALRTVLAEIDPTLSMAEMHGLKDDVTGGSGVHIKVRMIRSYARQGLGQEQPFEIIGK